MTNKSHVSHAFKISPFFRRIDKDVVHTYKGILLSHIQNKILPFAATWMQLEIIILSKVSQKEKDKYMISLTCEVKNMAQMNLPTKQKQIHRKTCGCQGREERERKGLGVRGW